MYILPSPKNPAVQAFMGLVAHFHTPPFGRDTRNIAANIRQLQNIHDPRPYNSMVGNMLRLWDALCRSKRKLFHIGLLRPHRTTTISLYLCREKLFVDVAIFK